jgi:hypothetical protein
MPDDAEYCYVHRSIGNDRYVPSREGQKLGGVSTQRLIEVSVPGFS